MNVVFNSIVLYARNMQIASEFYQKYFGFIAAANGEVVEGLIDLNSPVAGGASIRIHQAAKSVKLGQVGVKLSFSVEDVEAFKEQSAALGLVFGSTHLANGYCFANAKDPDGNSVSISSRAYRAANLSH
jgi:predicted enzyme related to lactoylglutathione lyase